MISRKARIVHSAAKGLRGQAAGSSCDHQLVFPLASIARKELTHLQRIVASRKVPRWRLRAFPLRQHRCPGFPRAYVICNIITVRTAHFSVWHRVIWYLCVIYRPSGTDDLTDLWGPKQPFSSFRYKRSSRKPSSSSIQLKGSTSLTPILDLGFIAVTLVAARGSS